MLLGDTRQLVGVSARLQVGGVPSRHELLQRAHVACLGVRVHQLRVHLQRTCAKRTTLVLLTAQKAVHYHAA
jgi:hypothetical protein